MKVGDIFKVPDDWNNRCCPVCEQGSSGNWPCNFNGRYCDKDGKEGWGVGQKYIKVSHVCENIPCICDQRVLLLAECQCFEESRKQYLESKKKEKSK